MRLIPYKKIFVRTNDDQILNITFSNRKSVCKKIPCIEKYVDCWNCIIASLKDAVEDPEVCDDDIILFKHETVFLNDRRNNEMAPAESSPHPLPEIRLPWSRKTRKLGCWSYGVTKI